MSKNTPVYSFENMTVENAHEMRALFIKMMDNVEAAVLDFDKTESIDLSGIQLLVALIRTSINKKVPLQFTGTVKDSVVEKLRTFGLCAEDCQSAEKLYEVMKSLYQEL